MIVTMEAAGAAAAPPSATPPPIGARRGWREARRRVRLRLVLIVLLVGLTIGAIYHFPVFEDAFITFRCAENFADGHGLNFNPDERVESSTAFFFALLLGLAKRRWGVDPVAGANLLNLAALAFILMALAARATRRADAVGPQPLASAGFWWAATQPTLWVYAQSGMETVFFAALTFAGFLAVDACLAGRRPAWPAGVALGVAAIVRMEAVAYAALATAAVFALGPPARRWNNAAWVGGCFAVIFAPALAWRWHYYGYPFPIAYYAKLDGGSPALAWRGLKYAATWLVVCPLAAATVATALVYFRRDAELRPRLRLGLIWLLAQLAIAVYLGGDYMPYARFLAPAIPVVACLLAEVAPVWLERAGRQGPKAAAWRRALAIAAIAVVPAWTMFFPPDLLLFVQEGAYLAAHRPVAQTLGRLIPDRRTTLFVSAAGVVPYYSKLHAYDGLGIADPAIAHRRVELGRGLAGHEKFDARRILTLKPDLVLCQVLPKDVVFRNLPYLRVDPQTGAQTLVDPLGRTHDIAALHVAPAFYSFAAQLQSLLNLYRDPEFLSQYELMQMRDSSSQALFFVRKDAAATVRDVFAPIENYSDQTGAVEPSAGR